MKVQDMVPFLMSFHIIMVYAISAWTWSVMVHVHVRLV